MPFVSEYLEIERKIGSDEVGRFHYGVPTRIRMKYVEDEFGDEAMDINYHNWQMIRPMYCCNPVGIDLEE